MNNRMGLPPSGRILLYALLVALSTICLLQPCRGDFEAQAKAPQADWIAFIAEDDSEIGDSFFAYFDYTPAVIIYREGRVIWRVAVNKSTGQATWLEGTIDKKQLAKFQSQMQATPFIQKRNLLQDRYVIGQTDQQRTVGIHLNGETIIYRPGIRRLSLPLGDENDDNSGPSLSAVAQMTSAIRALIPHQSHPYVPNAIHVWFAPMSSWAHPLPAQKWPLSGERLPTRNFVRTYSGKAMTQVLATLRRTFIVTDGKRKATVLWRPAIEIPIQSDPYAKERFVSEKWRAYKEGQIGGYEDMIEDLLRTHLRPGMTPDEVGKLLGKPDAKYAGRSLMEFGSNLPAGTARVWEWQLGRNGMWSEVDSYYLLVMFNKAGALASAYVGLH